MAVSLLRSKAFNHNRSLSLPSKPNPAFSKLQQTLSDVRSSDASFPSLSSMNDSLKCLNTMYVEIDDLLRPPHVRHIASREKWADQVSDGHISLLDACATAKDLVSRTKQNVRDLLSAIRRKDIDNISRYIRDRRRSKKTILKSLREIKGAFKSRHDIIASSEIDNEAIYIVCVLKASESITVAMFESLLSYLCGTTKVQARKTSGWPLVSKLMSSRRIIISCRNEFENIDSFMHTNLEYVQVEEIMSRLKGMDSSFQNLKEGLDCLFRQLIRTRVHVLNFLNH